MMAARKPNLFIIGAMKSGTSTLCLHLSEHPAVFMCPVKEPEHFSQPDQASRLTEQYLRLFGGASDQPYLAEGSTGYTKRPANEGVAERIHAFNPDARLIYLMRDPFERLVSHYRHTVRKGLEKESLPQALSRPSGYLPCSYYAYQLQPYLQLFGSQSLYLDTLESLMESPVAFCRRVFEWLGIDASVTPPSAGKRLNVSPDALETYDERTLRVRLARGLTHYLRYHPRLGRLVPEGARAWYRKLMPKKSVRKADAGGFVEEVQTARRAVQPLLADWIAELEELTGRCYPEWPSREGWTPSERPLEQPVDLWLPEEVLHLRNREPDTSW